MKVLFQIRSSYKSGAAGDSMQMLKTMEALKGLGVEVSVSTSPNVNLSGWDLIHIFNSTNITESYGFYRNAVQQKKRMIVSPVFIDMQEYYSKNSAKLASWRAANLMRREMLQGCQMLLPNSEKEMQWIRERLFVDTPYKVAYHGVDPIFSEGDPQWFEEKYGVKDYILYVGRLSPIKNQLALIRAVRGLSIPVVLIGPVNDKSYAEKCAKEAAGIVQYIPRLGQAALASAYRAAKVHVQPSWFETVGLTSLEAAAAGTPVVITNRGAAGEYFGDLAQYVEPGDVAGIRQVVQQAMEKPGDGRLQQHVLEKYRWELTAKTTLEAYEEVLDTGGTGELREHLYVQEYPLPSLKEMYEHHSDS